MASHVSGEDGYPPNLVWKDGVHKSWSLFTWRVVAFVNIVTHEPRPRLLWSVNSHSFFTGQAKLGQGDLDCSLPRFLVSGPASMISYTARLTQWVSSNLLVFSTVYKGSGLIYVEARVQYQTSVWHNPFKRVA